VLYQPHNSNLFIIELFDFQEYNMLPIIFSRYSLREVFPLNILKTVVVKLANEIIFALIGTV